jgi:hypothetical protein
LISWLSSNAIECDLRERKIITLSGIAPDIDGFGWLIDPLMNRLGYQTYYWDYLHHQLHNIGFGLLLTIIGFAFARTRKWIVAAVVFTVFHLHLLCDLVGSKGPDGYQWPIPYFLPFSDKVQFTWRYQWELNAWPNILIGFLLIGMMFWMARRIKRSPFEIISKNMETVFVRWMSR